MKAFFAVLALFVVLASVYAAEQAAPAKDLKGAEQFYYGYAAPYAAYGAYHPAAYAAYPAFGGAYYYR